MVQLVDSCVHRFLAGKGAKDWAKAREIPTVGDDELIERKFHSTCTSNLH